MLGLKDRMVGVGARNLVQAFKEPSGAYSVSKKTITQIYSDKWRSATKEKYRVP